MKRRSKITLLITLIVLVTGGFYAYNAFLFMYFISPGDGGVDYQKEIRILAGSNTGEAGFLDGNGSNVLMAKPIRLAPLNDSTVVFADINNHAIRTIDSNGNVSTIVGGPEKAGYQDGPADQAKIYSPHGVAVRSDGVIAVAEANNNIIRLLTPIQTFDVASSYYEVSTLAGIAGDGGFKDGTNAEALFDAPHAVAWGPNGELYVADIGNARIRMIKDGKTTTVAGRDKVGAQDGDLAEGTLRYPMDIALDKAGNLWIIDAAELTIRKWNREQGLTTPFPGLEIAMPHGIAIDDAGERIIIAEMYGNRILAYDMENGSVYTICGSDTEEIKNGLNKPAAVLVNKGVVWIADLGNNRIVVAELPIE
jgi:DNA-binding beta-propeller fold protein YncE